MDEVDCLIQEISAEYSIHKVVQQSNKNTVTFVIAIVQILASSYTIFGSQMFSAHLVSYLGQ